NSVRIEWGDSDQSSDSLNYTAPADAATSVDLSTSTINSTGAQPVSFAGVEHVNLFSSGANSTLTVAGTPNDDTVSVNPTAPGAGSFTASALPAVQFTYSGVGSAFTVNGGAGTDTLGIVGNAGPNTATITPTTATINGGVVTIGTGLEGISVSLLGGNDSLIV